MEANGTYHAANAAGQREGGEGAIVDTLLVQVADVNLDAGVVLSCDQLVGPGAAEKIQCLFVSVWNGIHACCMV